MQPLPYPIWSHKYELKPGLWIFKPTESCETRGKEIKRALEEKWTPPCYFFHLLPGGHVAALYTHQPNQFFVHLDISKFFNSINRSRVTRSLKHFFNYRTSRAYTLDSTVRHPNKSTPTYMLPYGFVQSPILASLSLRYSTLGIKLDKLSKAPHIQLSVYMDDIIISGNSLSNLKNIIDEVKESADRSGFKLNDAKEEGPAPTITAFNINLSTSKLNIEASRFREFQQHYRSTSNPRVQKGIKTYITSVNTDQLKNL